MQIYSDVRHVEALAAKPSPNHEATIDAAVRLRGGLHLAATITDRALRRLAAGDISTEDVGQAVLDAEAALRRCRDALAIFVAVQFPTEGSS